MKPDWLPDDRRAAEQVMFRYLMNGVVSGGYVESSNERCIPDVDSVKFRVRQLIDYYTSQRNDGWQARRLNATFHILAGNFLYKVRGNHPELVTDMYIAAEVNAIQRGRL